MNIAGLKEKWLELFIRFNTSPKLYQKVDFLHLLSLLKGILERGTGIAEDDLRTINGESLVGEGDIEVKGQVLDAGNALTISDNFEISVTSHTYDEENNNSAFGADNEMSGATNAFVQGFSNTVSADNSHAEGKDTEAHGEQSHSEGEFTAALGNNSHAEGSYTTSLGLSSHAEGEGGNVTLFKSSNEVNEVPYFDFYVTGLFASDSDSATNFFAGSDFLSDCDTTSTLERANKLAGWVNRPLYRADGELLGLITDISDGRIYLDRNVSLTELEPIYIKTGSSGLNSHTEGFLSDATGLQAHAEGEQTRATGTSAHSEGTKTKAFGKTSHAEGEGTEALAIGSHAEGKQTHTEGEFSHTEGYDTKASGTFAHGEGCSSSAQGDYSHAEGYDSQSSGGGAHAEGAYTNAQGMYSHAEGYNTTTDSNAHWQNIEAEITVVDQSDDVLYLDSSYDITRNNEYKLIADGYDPVVIRGYECETDGEEYKLTPSDHAYINGTIEIDVTYTIYKKLYTVAAHAEGKDTTAVGTAAHSEGINTKAEGNAAHAEGVDSQALATGAHADGLGIIVDNEFEHSVGKYNVSNFVDSDVSTLYSIGIGTASNRKNALEVLNNGLVYINGIGAYDGASLQDSVSLLEYHRLAGIIIAAALNDLNDRINEISQLST